jgi:hypothetical protein
VGDTDARTHTLQWKLFAGFTDRHFTRDAGIASYGFPSMFVPEAELVRIHCNDERASEAAFRRGVDDHLAIIEAVVYP